MAKRPIKLCFQGKLNIFENTRTMRVSFVNFMDFKYILLLLLFLELFLLFEYVFSLCVLYIWHGHKLSMTPLDEKNYLLTFINADLILESETLCDI